MWPKHYSLHGDHEKHFTIHDSRDNTVFNIAKKDVHPATQIKVMKMQKFAGGGGVMDEIGDGDPKGVTQDLQEGINNLGVMSGVPDAPPPPDEGLGVMNGAPAGGLNGMSLAQVTQPTSLMQYTPPVQTAGVATPAKTPQMSSSIPGAPTPGDMRGIQGQYDKSLQAEAQGQIEQNKKIAALYAPYIEQEQRRAEETQSMMRQYQAQNDKLSADIADQKIDPNKLWHEKSTGNKVGSILSIMLAGLGQGLSGANSNMAVDMLNKQIDRDIEGQKLSLGKKQSLLSDNLRIQGNLMQAEQATRLQMSSILQGQMAKIAAESSNPMIMEKAKQQGLMMRHGDLQLMDQLAQNAWMRNANLQAMNGGDPETTMNFMRMVNPARAKEMESRYVPGAGFASVPVPDDSRKQISERKQLQIATQRLEDFTKQHEGSLDPATVSEGQVLSKQVQDMYRRANGQGVFKPAEAEFVNGIVEEDPTKFFAKYRTLPKYKALKEMNGQELQGLYNTYGLKGQPIQTQPVERQTQDGRIGLFDPGTKKFLGFKNGR